MSSVAAKREREPIVNGEFAFTAEDFRQIAAILHADSGIHLPDAKATLVYSRLAKRLRALGLESFRDYCALVQDAGGIDERQSMLAALTTNVTRFFREPHHFDDLRQKVLEPAAEALRKGARMRLWSAACSSGQEPYSMAMTVLSVLPEANRLDVKILATDIDPVIIRTAKAARYRAEMANEIPTELRRKWIEPLSGGEWTPREEVRSLVSFRELNLIGDWPMKGAFQAIFCRNVVIYFEEETQARIWRRFASYMAPAGRLYIGHSERVADAAFAADGLTSYRFVGTGR